MTFSFVDISGCTSDTNNGFNGSDFKYKIALFAELLDTILNILDVPSASVSLAIGNDDPSTLEAFAVELEKGLITLHNRIIGTQWTPKEMTYEERLNMCLVLSVSMLDNNLDGDNNGINPK